MRETQRLPRITTWEDMKEKLNEKYLPFSYRQCLMDRWQKLTQGTSTVADYIARFEEFHMRCGVIEEKTVTLSRFRAGLREEIQKELILREITILGQAY